MTGNSYERWHLETAWILLGIMIGFYGNWYISIIEKITQFTDTQYILLVASLSSISLYFLLITSLRILQAPIVTPLRYVTMIPSGIHGITTFYLVNNVNTTVNEFKLIGYFIWLTIIIIEFTRLKRYVPYIEAP